MGKSILSALYMEWRGRCNFPYLTGPLQAGFRVYSLVECIDLPTMVRISLNIYLSKV